ncbi:MAG: esterase-like activity of phytase family protein [Polaribacter sp.]
MKNACLLILLISFFTACKKTSVASKKSTSLITSKANLHFLDEYVLQDSLVFKNSIIGGLSGIDYANGLYHFVVDDQRNPRFLSANINIQNNKINTIDFKEVLFLSDSISHFYKENALDLESIFMDEETEEFYFVSEGFIKGDKQPSVFTTNKEGVFKHQYKLPTHFSDLKNVKQNAVFEGSTKSKDGKGFWVAMEGVLKADGVEPTFKKTQSPVRITYFDKKTKNATKQFAYQLEHITKPAKGNINLNGVTAILEYKENHFFVIERTYQNGYGVYGNIVKIFEVSIDNETTNTLEINSLKEQNFILVKKRLAFNFEDVKNKLTDGIVDNLEGITLGPKLANGNQSLILVSDDNFQKYGKQLNQFILLEITDK